ncbi:MAG: hypothetical protein AAGI11_06360 [Pseudomonadota bacterium]
MTYPTNPNDPDYVLAELLSHIEQRDATDSESRAKTRLSSPRLGALKTSPSPVYMRPAAAFVRFLRKNHVVIYANSPSPTSTLTAPSNQGLLNTLESLPPEDLQSLITEFLKSHPVDAMLLAARLKGKTISSDLSKADPFIRFAMYQVALGDENVCTFTVRLGQDFLERLSQRTHDNLSQLINDRVKTCLNEFLPGQAVPFWFVLENSGTDIAGFHIHGEVVADKDTLPLVKQAFEKTGLGYQQRWKNRRVHFGEPTLSSTNRSGQCLSEVDNPERVSGSSMSFHWANYSAKDVKYVQSYWQSRDVRLGKLWKTSTGLNQEAAACLGLFKLLLDYQPARAGYA